MSKIIATILLAFAATPHAIADDTVNYKFPIVQKQFPDLQKTVKAPTIVWQSKEKQTETTEENQNHIISPLFYYQEVVKKAK